MNFESLKDPLIVSCLFFAFASDWFDSYIRDLFPQLKTTNPVVFTLVKTVAFLIIYWIYQKVMSGAVRKIAQDAHNSLIDNSRVGPLLNGLNNNTAAGTTTVGGGGTPAAQNTTPASTVTNGTNAATTVKT